jgi:hypothetical protein
MYMDGVLFSYLGPETIVPAASVIATIVGGLLAFGRRGLSWIAWCARRIAGRPEPIEPSAEAETTNTIDLPGKQTDISRQRAA